VVAIFLVSLRNISCTRLLQLRVQIPADRRDRTVSKSSRYLMNRSPAVQRMRRVRPAGPVRAQGYQAPTVIHAADW
jgi:hypothetical protein